MTILRVGCLVSLTFSSDEEEDGIRDGNEDGDGEGSAVAVDDKVGYQELLGQKYAN